MARAAALALIAVTSLTGLESRAAPAPSLEERTVVVRFTGGKDERPLSGLRVDVRPRGIHLHRPPVASVTTDDQGRVELRLRPGMHVLELSANEALPYVHRLQYLDVGRKSPPVIRFERNLDAACEVVFRAVDVETGKGVPGVMFTREQAGAELWGVDPLTPDNIVPPDSTAPYRTDGDGECRCLVASGFPWTYQLHRLPEGYREVRPEHLRLATAPGGRLTHTFKLRRRPTPPEPRPKR